MKSKAPSYLRQLAQPVPMGGAVLSVPRRARGRVSEKFGLAGVPVIQDAEETMATPLMSRDVPVAVSAARQAASKPVVAEIEAAGSAPRRVVTRRVDASRPAAAAAKPAEVKLEPKPRVKTAAAPREEASAFAPLQQRMEEAAQDVRGERERSVSPDAVPQSKSQNMQPITSPMEAVAAARSAEKRAAEQKDAAVDMHRDVLRVERTERERVIESEIRSLEAKPQREPQAAPQFAPQAEPKPAEQRASIHIGTVEVRVVTPAPPAPLPLPQRQVESQPSRLAPPAPAPSLARSLAWNYGLVQG